MAEIGEPKKGWRERHKAHFADDMKKRQEARETEYKAHKAKGLEEGTGTAVTFPASGLRSRDCHICYRRTWALAH